MLGRVRAGFFSGEERVEQPFLEVGLDALPVSSTSNTATCAERVPDGTQVRVRRVIMPFWPMLSTAF
jgi:hypothetical protein